MKKTVIICLLISCAFIFTQCQKEKSLGSSTILSSMHPMLRELYDQMPAPHYGNINVLDNNILCFHSIMQYEGVMASLQRECEIWDSLFFNTYGYLGEEQLRALELEIGYDEFLPIALFEERFGVSGQMLFDEQQCLKQSWMSNNLDGDNPIDPVFILESEQALHTPYREVCIHDTLYQYRQDALIVVPIGLYSKWQGMRDLSTLQLLGDSSIIVKYLIDFQSNDKAYFKCGKNGVLTQSNMQSLSNYDRSYWMVSGRINMFQMSKLTSKIENYKYVNATTGYRRTRKVCSIATTDQTFFKEHYRLQNLNRVLINTDFENVTMHLPEGKYRRTVSNVAKVHILQTIPHSLLDKYKYGVNQGVSLSINIDGSTLDTIINLN